MPQSTTGPPVRRRRLGRLRHCLGRLRHRLALVGRGGRSPALTALRWARAGTLGAGLLTLAVARSLPLLQQHPFALLYAYVVGATWWGDLADSLLALVLSVVGSAALLTGFGALPLEEVLFALASLVLLLLVHRLRRAHTAAEVARAAAEAATRQVQGVQAVSDVALAHLGTDELLHQLLDRISALLAVDNAAILLLSADGSHLTIHMSHGPEEEAAGAVRIPLGQGIAGRIAASRSPLIVEDMAAEQPVNPWLAATVRSLLGVPLLVEGRVIGVIHVDSLTPRRFTAEEQRLLELVAARVALAIEHARLYRAERAARAAAEAAVQVRDDVLAAVSHDLKSPLGAIKGLAQVLQRRAQGPAADGERLVAGLQQIDRAATRMARLINELLDAAQVQAGRALALERRPLDLVALVQQAVAAQQQATTQHQIVVEAAVPDLVGSWDAFRLERVLDNLLSNAVKYSPDGGPIVVRVRPEGADGAVVVVQDEGLGIPAADLPHIFERFHRARNVRGARGTGLGLAGARQIVAQHGGTLTIDSQEGVGTTVHVWLPRAPASPSDAPA